MLPLPSVPADNLYKFVGIAGLATAILAVALEVQFELSFMNSRNEFSKQKRKLVVESFRHLAIREVPQDAQDDLTSRVKDLSDNEIHASRIIIAARLWFAVQFVVGAIAGRKGFNLWWTRCQQYQDQILKSQYEKEIEKPIKLDEQPKEWDGVHG